MKNKILVSFILFVGFTLQMDAQRDFRGSCHPNKKERIKDGIKSGELTRPEVRPLAHQNRNLNRAKKHALADGKITKAEKRQLRKLKKQQNRNLYHQKHDGQRRRF